MGEKKYTPFFEMAYPKYEIESKIEESQFRIIEHVVKLLLYPEHTNFHRGWINSIYKQVVNLADMRWVKNNSYLKQQNYYNCYFIKPFENDDNYNHLDKIVKYVIKETEKIYKAENYKNYNKEYWIILIKNFYYDVATLLSAGEENWDEYRILITNYFVNINENGNK